MDERAAGWRQDRDSCLVEVNNKVDIHVIAMASEAKEGGCAMKPTPVSSSNVSRGSEVGREVGKGRLCGSRA